MLSGRMKPTLFGIAGFLILGLWVAFQCSFNWVGNGSLVCGGLFILMAPVGYFAGLLVRRSVKVLVRIVVPGKSDDPRF